MKRESKPAAFDLKVEFDRETDGRWIADIPALPGVMVYGRTRKQALAAGGSTTDFVTIPITVFLVKLKGRAF